MRRTRATLGEVFRIILWCGVPAIVLAVGGGWWMMRRALAPVAALTEAAARINEHNLANSLPRSGNGDELDRLTQVFNDMTERLDRSFARIREFTLHASHELKTPLTVMHSELETALQDSALSATQREHLESELDEVQRLAKIVDGLTLLTKADAGQIQLAREPVRLDELVQDACADAQSLARPRAVQVSMKECQPLTVTGRPPPPPSIAAQPDGQRHQVQPAARHSHPEPAAGGPSRPNWPSPTPVLASRPTSCRASSTLSSGATPATARQSKAAALA